MADPNESIIETAKATQEVAKTTSNAIDLTREAGGFISKYIAGPLEQGIGIFEDRLRYARWERQLRLMTRANQLLGDLGLSGPTKAVPLKIAIPLLQAAAIEEDDSLQDKWAALLVNAANESCAIEIRRAYIDILEKITTRDAALLEVIYPPNNSFTDGSVIWTNELPEVAKIRTDENEMPPEEVHISNEIKLSLANLDRLGCLRLGHYMDGGQYFGSLSPTVLGAAFVEACRTQKN